MYYLVNLNVGVWRYDGSTGVVHSLSREVPPEPPCLALQPLNKPSGRLLGLQRVCVCQREREREMCVCSHRHGKRYSGYFAVDVQCTLQLEKVPALLQTHTQTDGQTHTQTDTHTDRRSDTHRQTDRRSDTHTDRQTDGQNSFVNFANHDHLDFGPLRAVFLNDIVQEYDLREFHCHIVFSPSQTHTHYR